MFPRNYFPGNYFAPNYWPGAGEAGGPGPGGDEPVWENAIVLTRVTRGTQLTTAALPPGNWITFIKAFDNTGNESVNAASSNIEVSNRNDVVVSQIENPRWTGLRTDFIKHDISNRLVPDSLSLASASGWDTFDVFVVDPVIEAIYEVAEIDLTFDSVVRLYAELEGIIGPGESGGADPILLIDHRKSSASYDGFEEWSVGSAELQFVKAKIKIVTATGIASLAVTKIILDVEERTEGATSVSVAGSGGTVITFATPFHFVPRVNLTVDSGSALFPTKASVTRTQFRAHIWNFSGGEPGGTLDWEAEGA